MSAENGKPQSALAAALAAYARKEEEKSLSRDRSACIPLIRLRDLASIALTPTLSATTEELEHFQTCRSCTNRLRKLQSSLGTNPRTLFKTKLGGKVYFAAEELFDCMHGHDAELVRAHTQHFWLASHDLARALRHSHRTGDDVRVVLSSMEAAIVAVVSDPLTKWARSFDASWPLAQLLIEGAAEVDPDTDEPAVFADMYARIVGVTPVPLKAVLVYNVGALFERGPRVAQTALAVAARIAERKDDEVSQVILAMLARTEAPQIAEMITNGAAPRLQPFFDAIDDAVHALHTALMTQTPYPGVATPVRNYVCGTAEAPLTTRDAVQAMLQLIATRHYIRTAIKQIPLTNLVSFVVDDVFRVLLKRTLREHGRLVVAMELAGPVRNVASFGKLMADFLVNAGPPLRQALFVYFVESLERDRVSTGAGTKPRFAGEGSDWTFEGGAAHPLRIFGERAAIVARHDPDVAQLIEWSNGRLDAVAEPDVTEEEEPAGV